MPNSFQERFYFISNASLQNRLGDALRYISELTSLTEKSNEEVSASFYQTIIIFTASIIEAVLHHALKELVKEDIFEEEWQYKDQKILYEISSISPLEQVVAGKRTKKKIKIHGNVSFRTIIQICDKFTIFSKGLCEKVHQVREMRNKIHLTGLSEIDRPYRKEEMNFAFEIAKEVLDTIEEKLH